MSGFDETVDFVVVGSGGGSMAAGLVMRKASKSVLILEKTDLIGGTTARSGGVMWIPNNRFMARDNVPDSPDQAATYLDNVVGDHDDTPGATRERRLAYIAEAPRMVDFLVHQGIKLTRVPLYPDYDSEKPGASVPGRTVVAELFNLNELGEWKSKLRPGFLHGIPAMLFEAQKLPYLRASWEAKRTVARVGLRTILSKLTGKQYATAGAALQGRMLQASLKAGVNFYVGAGVSELIEEDGRITGVVTTKDGRPWRIGAKLGVLVNAGGFARNQAMRDRYQPGTKAIWTSVAEGDTGEMIQEMMRHGAAIAQMEEMVGHQNTITPGAEAAPMKPSAQGLTAGPHAILVDQSGVRYLNEGGSYMRFCQNMLARDKIVPASPSFTIFDAQAMARYMVSGTMPGSKKPQAWTDSGYLKSADTIEDLAIQLKIDPVTLRGTVDRFNGFVDKGRDEDFGRGDSEYDQWLGDPYHPGGPSLGKIEKGPFYAIPVVPGDVGTYGGVVTDVNGRVLKEDGTPIVGLYATGVSTASVMGRAYPGAGSSVGPSFTWGFVAAKHAAGADNSIG